MIDRVHKRKQCKQKRIPWKKKHARIRHTRKKKGVVEKTNGGKEKRRLRKRQKSRKRQELRKDRS